MKVLISFIFSLYIVFAYAQSPSDTPRSIKAIADNSSMLQSALEEKGMQLGDPIFIRIFKQSNELEVWIQPQRSNEFQLFKTYEICYYSGNLGPKTRQGDGQSPEGFYFINADRFNPWSSFHLSLNMGYPNAYDRSKDYTGNYLMIHGNCVSIGCYAMTDAGIEEIYTIAYKAVENGQSFFRIHSFPFRMTREAMEKNASNQWIDFWQNLKTGYDWFEQKKTPPNVRVADGQYVFN